MGLFTAHTDLAAVADHLSRITEEKSFPVLGPLPPVADFLSRQAVESPAPCLPEAMTAFVVAASSPALPVAEGLAAGVSGKVVRVNQSGDWLVALSEAADNADLVVLVGLSEELPERLVISAHDLFWDRVGTRRRAPSLGVLTGQTVADLVWLAAKGLSSTARGPAAEQHVRLWPALDERPAGDRTGPLLVRQQARHSEVAKLLTEKRSGVLSVIAHARDDVLHLHDTIICAAEPADLGAVGRDLAELGHAPICVFTGRCFRSDIDPADFLHASRILADVVFANGCMSWRSDDGLFPARYLLPHAFVRGAAAAYVGAPNLVNGIIKLNDLFHLAMAQNSTVGEATDLVNDHLRYERTDLPYFTCLGLPWIRLNGNGGADRHPPVLKVAGSNDRGGAIAAAARTLATTDRTETTHVVLVSPRTSHLLPGPGTVLTPDPMHDEIRSLGASIEALESAPLLGFRFSRQGNLTVNLREQISTLASSLQTAAASGDVRRIERRIATLRRSVASAEQHLAEALFERGTESYLDFDDLWTQVLERRPPKPTGDDCPYCRRPLLDDEASHPLFPRIGRRTTQCMRCGIIVDRDSHGPVRSAVLRCDEIWSEASAVDITVEVELSSELPLRDLRIAVHSENSTRHGIGYDRPWSVEVTGRTTVSISTVAEVSAEAQTHQQYLRALLVVNGTINYAARPVWIRPAGWAD